MLNITRIPAGVATSVTTTFFNPTTEAAQDADAAVTCAVTHVNGTVILAAGTATVHGANGSGQYSVTIPAQANPAEAAIVWSGTFGGAARTQTENISVVGGYFAELAEIRALDALNNTTTYPTAVLIAKRESAESLFEQATGRAWVQRYARDVLDGDPTYRRALMPVDQIQLLHLTRRLTLTNEIPRRLLAVLIDDGSGSNLVAQTDVPTGYQLYPGGEIERVLTSNAWPRGLNNVVVEYVFGVDRPPADLKEAFLRYVRYLILNTNGRIPDRANMMTTEVGTFSLGMASGWEKPTGISEVDAVLARYGNRVPVIA